MAKKENNKFYLVEKALVFPNQIELEKFLNMNYSEREDYREANDTWFDGEIVYGNEIKKIIKVNL